MERLARQRTIGILGVAWVAMLLATAAVVVAYPALPDLVPAYRTPAGPVLRTKSLLLVLRVPLISALQLALVTVVVAATQRTAVRAWQRLWSVGALALSAKALAEALWFAALAAGSTRLQSASNAGTAAAVVAFLAYATWAWRSGALDAAGSGVGPEESKAIRIAAIVTALGWAALATVPLW